MTTRIGLVAGALLLAALALWHPAPRPAFQTAPAASFPPKSTSGVPAHHGRGGSGGGDSVDAVVYVAGAVRRPGLYHMRAGDRAADAVARAGGLSETADAAGVNLAARAADGAEIYVPVVGENVTARRNTSGAGAYRGRRTGRLRSSNPNVAVAAASVDINVADARALEEVPAVGRSRDASSNCAIATVRLRRSTSCSMLPA